MSATFVLDSSVAVAWCFPVQSTELSHRALQELQMGGTAWVPSLFAIEVANALTRSVRLGAISPTRADEFASDLLDLPLEFELTAAGHALGKVRALASRLKLSAYDAMFLELAARLGLPLATLDEGLRRAARKSSVALLGAA